MANAANNSLEHIYRCLDIGDLEPARTEILTFISKNSADWPWKMLLHGYFSEPLQRDFNIQRNLSVLKIIAAGVHEEIIRKEDAALAANIVLCANYIAEARDLIVKKLAQLSSVLREPAQQLYRIATFLESQMIYGMELATSQPTFVPSDLLVDNIGTTIGLTKSSHVAGTESHCDEAEVIIKNVYFSFTPSSIDLPLDASDSPYEDADFEKMLLLASYWSALANIWEGIKYLKWTPTIGEQTIVLRPPNPTQLIYKEIGVNRENQLALEWAMAPFRSFPEIMQQVHELIDRLSEDVAIQENGTEWGLNFDVNILKKIYEHPGLRVSFNQIYFPERSFIDERLLQSTYVGPNGHTLTLESFINVLKALGIIAKTIRAAIQKKSSGNASPFRYVPILSIEKLEDLISFATKINRITVKNGLSLCASTTKRSKLEIYDRVLLPIGGDKIIFLVGVALIADPIRTIQNHLSESKGQLGTFFNKRGKLFEKDIANRLRKQPNIKVKAPLKSTQQGMPEFDIMFFWDGYLFLAEAKCVNHVATGRELYDAWENVSYSVEQLLVRKQFILNNWSLIRTLVPDLGLPVGVVSAEKIVCISITNTMAFTGMMHKGVPIVDDVCFNRYFGEYQGTFHSMDKGKIVSEKKGPLIRISTTPAADEFRQYIINPPQVNRYLDKTEVQLEGLWPLEDGRKGFLFPVSKTTQHIDTLTSR